MSKMTKILTLFLGLTALVFSGKIEAIGFPMVVDFKPANVNHLVKAKETVETTRNTYQTALELLNKETSQEEKEQSLDQYILKQDDSDILFKNYLTTLKQNMEIVKKQGLSLPEGDLYQTAKTECKDLCNSLNALYIFAQETALKKRVTLCINRLENKYGPAFAVANSQATMAQLQTELQRLMMTSFARHVDFKYLQFTKDLDEDIDTLHKAKKLGLQQLSLESVNAMIVKLYALRSMVTETYCFQEEYRAHKNEQRIARKLDRAFAELRSHRSKLGVLQATYQDAQDLYKFIRYLTFRLYVFGGRIRG